jgi:Zn-dependent protease with chaperone function
MRVIGALVCFALSSPVAVLAGGGGKEEKVDGYAEWREGDLLIVDGQRLRAGAPTKFTGKDAAKDFASTPLGYEVKAKGTRQADGTLLAVEIEAKPNGSALFEKEIRQMTDGAEADYRKAGSFFQAAGNGRVQVIGRLHDSGPQVERVRRIVDDLVPPYISPETVRVYVIENKEWNAFAMGNFSIYVFSGLLDDLDDDEVAIVLGHEITHATHEHTRRQFKKQMWIQIALLGVTAAAEDVDDKHKRAVIDLLAVFAATAWQSGYGRGMEDQADRVGLRYCYEAGYDVSKGPRLWNRFAKKYGESGKAANFFFGDHSLSSARAVNLQRELRLNYPEGPRPRGVLTTPLGSVQPREPRASGEAAEATGRGGSALPPW